MPTCYNCEAFVTADFARVFGDNEDRVYRCTECTSYRALVAGEGGRAEV
jgi:DNA-directed RNA polymerase subunit RPC12/RpoP